VFADLRRYPKLVGGIDDASTARAVALYRDLLDFDDRPDLPRPNGVWDLGTSEAAELAKLAETTYRDVNIALANQFARFAEQSGIDIHAVIEACNSQPFSHIHSPGVAVGGHCIPVYPHLYLSTDPSAELVRAARETNSAMPDVACERLAATFDGSLAGLRVVILGAAYRGGVKETAFSGVFPLVDALRRRHAVPLVHDPLYDDGELRSLGLTPFHRGEPADAVIVQANHEEYRDWGPADVPGIRCVLDGRAWTTPERWPGVTHLTIGRG
jgi:nucleotide sugar dehydrogenase